MLTMLGARTTSKKHLQGIWLSTPSLYPKASVLKDLVGHFLYTVAALKPQSRELSGRMVTIPERRVPLS